MLLYLTSLTSKSIDKIDFRDKKKVAFIATAADIYDNKSFVENDRQALLSKGLEIHDVDIKDYLGDELYNVLKKFEILFFSGGCAHYLLLKMKTSGFNTIIRQLLDEGLIYIGSSAGSVVLCPSIDFIKPMDHMHIYVPDLTDFSGLNIVNFYMLPHYGREKYAAVCDQILKNKDLRIVAVKDDEVVIINNDRWEKV